MTSPGSFSVDPDADPLLQLAFTGLDHAIDSVEVSGGPLIPFLLARTGDRLSLQRFVTERLEDGVAEVEQHLEAVVGANGDRTAEVDGACGAWDGYITVEGGRSDAVLARAVDRTGAEVVLAQRYEVRGRLRKTARRVGNAALIADNRRAQLFIDVVTRLFREACRTPLTPTADLANELQALPDPSVAVAALEDAASAACRGTGRVRDSPPEQT